MSEKPKVEQVIVTYSQPCDISLESQRLTISTADNGAGTYFALQTERWAIDNVQELIDLLEDFKNRSSDKT
jgi:hypothetical protein